MWQNRLSSLLTVSPSPSASGDTPHDDESGEHGSDPAAAAAPTTPASPRTMMSRKRLPPRSTSSHKKKPDAAGSPESPDPSRPIRTATTDDDLSFADFPNLLEDFLTTTTDDGKKYTTSERSSVALFRRLKLSSVDVASVGNASDTLVSVSSETQLTGRELHEKAKVRDVCERVRIFVSIHTRQARRICRASLFSHSSVCVVLLLVFTIADVFQRRCLQPRPPPL
jgi:hypothetical protein